MSDLPPREIIARYHSKEIDLSTLINYFISIIEENDNEQLRAEAIDYLGKLNFKKDFKTRVFKLIERIFISDENHLIRELAAKSLVNLFPEKCLEPLKWAINHEKTLIVFKTIVNLIDKLGKSKRNSLKKEIAEKFGVNPKEVEYFCDRVNFLGERQSNRDKNLGLFFCQLNSREDFKLSMKSGDSSYGSYLVESGRVTAIDLSSWELEEVPQSLKILKRLKKLDLGTNSLKSIPDWIGEFKDLNYLNLNRNCLKTIPKSIFLLSKQNFAQRYVNKGVHPHDAPVLSILEILTGHTLKNINFFGGHGEMRHFELNEEGFIKALHIDLASLGPLQFIPKYISLLTHLEKLIISDRAIDTFPEVLMELSNLKILYITSSSIEVIPNSIEKFTFLEEFNLSGNKICEIPESIGKLISLK